MRSISEQWLPVVQWFRVGLEGGGERKKSRWQGSAENCGGRLPLGIYMHKDESTGANIAPTNQSDNGWRAQLSWQFPNCDRNMARIQLGNLCL